jgi:hypothetical protein
VSEQQEPVNEEFAAFREEFLDHILEASGVPEDERDLWRALRVTS